MPKKKAADPQALVNKHLGGCIDELIESRGEHRTILDNHDQRLEDLEREDIRDYKALVRLAMRVKALEKRLKVK